jgi:hypothetical protein
VAQQPLGHADRFRLETVMDPHGIGPDAVTAQQRRQPLIGGAQDFALNIHVVSLSCASALGFPPLWSADLNMMFAFDVRKAHRMAFSARFGLFSAGAQRRRTHRVTGAAREGNPR